MVKCDYCGMDLPEKGNTHYMICRGRIDDGPACMQCVKKIKLTILRLDRA